VTSGVGNPFHSRFELPGDEFGRNIMNVDERPGRRFFEALDVNFSTQ
jgi:hypothetical protein